jgi:hypothetical protein
VGDKCAITLTGYRSMVLGEVVKLTPKGCKVKFATGHSYRPFEETFRAPDMLVKVAC